MLVIAIHVGNLVHQVLWAGVSQKIFFALTGFTNWKHATGNKGALVGHSDNLSHKEAMVAW